MKRRFFFWCVLSASLAWTPAILLADVFVVDSAVDAVDAEPGDQVCATAEGECTLRAAVMEANARPGNDAIRLPTGVFQLTIPGILENDALRGDLDVRDTLVINGGGPELTVIDGGRLDRAMDLLDGTLTLNGLTIRNSLAPDVGGAIVTHGPSPLTLTNCRVENNTARGVGGAISLERGALRAVRTVFASNLSLESGGAIHTEFGVVDLEDSRLVGNEAEGNGGGIYSESALIQMVESDILDGRALRGAALYALRGDVSIHLGNILRNIAGFPEPPESSPAGVDVLHGGAVWLGIGDIDISRSTLAANEARDGSGGALFLGPGDHTVENSTISGNVADDEGGGLWLNEEGTLAINYSTIVLNTAAGEDAGGGLHNLGEVDLADSIVALNELDCGFEVNSLTVNLDSDDSCGLTEDDLPETDPLLSDLGANGGVTLTHLPMPESPVLDVAALMHCSGTDQRGVTRPQGDLCDIGAVESGDLADVLVLGEITPDPVIFGQPLTYGFRVLNNGPSLAENVFLFSRLPSNADFISVDGFAECQRAGALVTCSVPDLDPGQFREIEIVVVPSSPGSLLNQTEVTTDTLDLELENNRLVTSVTPASMTDVVFTKMATSSATAGDIVDFGLNVGNLGPLAAARVDIVDSLPPEVEFDSFGPIIGGTCGVEVNVVTCRVNNLLVGELASFVVRVRVVAGSGSIVNTGTATIGGLDTDPSNNTSTVTLAILRRGDFDQNGVVDASDLMALALEIADGDGDNVADVGGGTFPGVPAMDLTRDGLVNDLDIEALKPLLFQP